MTIAWRHALLALVLALAAASPAAAVDDGRCRVNGEILTGDRSLPHTLGALRHRRRLTVVAIGSSSTQGYGSTAPSRAYPAQFAAILQQRFPGTPIVVRNKGVGGDDIDNMLARFPRDVFAEKPDLVIWQTGTNDAIRHVPLAMFQSMLRKGLDQIKAHGSDVILMTPQYAPQFTGTIGYGDYMAAMRQVASQAGVPVFDRFFPSMAWLADRNFADSPVLTSDGLHQTDTGYRCVAVLLANRLADLAATGH